MSEANELELKSEGDAARLLIQCERELEQKCEEVDKLQHQLDSAKTVSIYHTLHELCKTSPLTSY